MFSFSPIVIAGLDPAIQRKLPLCMDARVKPGHGA